MEEEDYHPSRDELVQDSAQRGKDPKTRRLLFGLLALWLLTLAVLVGVAYRGYFDQKEQKTSLAQELNAACDSGEFGPNIEPERQKQLCQTAEKVVDDNADVKPSQGPKGDPGKNGASAYEVWLSEGYRGTPSDFINFLKGSPGANGESAYQLWLDAGNEGTLQGYIQSLKGDSGTDGQDGSDGNDGTNGENGASAYQVWLSAGNTGTRQDFLNSLKGAKGDPGEAGAPGKNGDQGPEGPEGPAGVVRVQTVGCDGPLVKNLTLAYDQDSQTVTATCNT